jgi:hypothetical protein
MPPTGASSPGVTVGAGLCWCPNVIGHEVHLSRGRVLRLFPEPGDRPVKLWRLAGFNAEGQSVGGWTFTESDAYEVLMGLHRLTQLVDAQGLEGVG